MPPSPQRSGHWFAEWLGIEPRLGRQLIHVVAAVLGTAATLLFISIGFHLLPTDYAVFGGIACSVVAGMVESLGPTLFPGDRESVVAENVKLQAALAMSAGPQKDQTLLNVAREAAGDGENEVVLFALQSVQDVNVRDEAAADCALEIAKNHGAESALPLARLIQDNARRNDVLQRLAET